MEVRKSIQGLANYFASANGQTFAKMMLVSFLSAQSCSETNIKQTQENNSENEKKSLSVSDKNDSLAREKSNSASRKPVGLVLKIAKPAQEADTNFTLVAEKDAGQKKQNKEDCNAFSALTAADSAEVFSYFAPPTQTFHISASQTISLQCEQGTEISIPKNAFVFQDGKPVNGNIDLEVREFYQKSDMLLSGLATLSDSSVLESGGMLYMEARSNGKKLKLQKDLSIELNALNTQPSQKNDMSVFVSDGNMNQPPAQWKNTGKAIKNQLNADTASLNNGILAYSEGMCYFFDVSINSDEVWTEGENKPFSFRQSYTSPPAFKKKGIFLKPVTNFPYFSDSVSSSKQKLFVDVQKVRTDYYLYEQENDTYEDELLVEYHFNYAEKSLKNFKTLLVHSSNNAVESAFFDVALAKDPFITRKVWEHEERETVFSNDVFVQVAGDRQCSYSPKLFRLIGSTAWQEEFAKYYLKNVAKGAKGTVVLKRKIKLSAEIKRVNTENYYVGEKSWLTEAQVNNKKAEIQRKIRSEQAAINKRLKAVNDSLSAIEIKNAVVTQQNFNSYEQSPVFEVFSFTTRRLGWINCDRFVKETLINFDILSDEGSRTNAAVRICFLNRSSILPVSNGSVMVPKNAPVIVTSLVKKEGSYHFAIIKTNTKLGKANLEHKEMSLDAVRELTKQYFGE